MTNPTHPLPEEFDPFATPVAITLPTTPAQMEMWLSEQSGGGAGGAYNESFSVRLTGKVDDASLVRALCSLPDFHEALRGRFSEDGREFILAPSVDITVARHDLSALPKVGREAELAKLVQAESAVPYDLVNGPLFRASLVTLGEDSRVVFLSAHHTVCDGWSLDVLLADFARLYSAYVGAAPLPDPPRHGFSDYFRLLETPASRAKIASSRTYWMRAFAELPPPLTLPEDNRRPLERTFAARHGSHTVAPALVADLRAFAKQHSLSLFTVLFSGYAAFLHRISGAADLVVGIPVAGHPEADMEDCVGHLVNLVPVRLRFSDGISFLDVCRQAENTLLDARENAHLGFGEIVKDLRIPRDPSRVPLVTAIFTHVQRYAAGKLVFAGCDVAYDLNPRAAETFELSLNAIEEKTGLTFHAHANADLFSPSWLFWRLRELETLLAVLVASPGIPLGQPAYLPKDELGILLAGGAHTKIDYPSDLNLAALVERQAAATPGATAVVAGDVQLTYAELDARANRIANALRDRGVGRGMLVGLCLERGPDLLPALLAIAKSGAGYVPLDPSFPPDRLAYMIADSGLSVVVSQSGLAGVHRNAPECTLELDTHADAVANAPATAPPNDDHAARPEDLAYVIYTSGSTGRPKGVCIRNRAAVNLIESVRKEPGLSPGDRLLAVTTLSFDIAVFDTFGGLASGATIVLATRDQAMDGDALLDFLQRQNITFLQATPVTWRFLLAAGWTGSPGLKAIVTGEAFPRDLGIALLPKVGELWNMYGPTETTVWSTGGRVENPERGIDIGRPVANTSIWILDDQRNPCPIGVVGEIYIGGDGVAQGYLGRPELTAEKFVPDPFAAVPGAKMYRTGDLGRLRTGGRIECLGRADFQVKVRGFRIELGEIETILARHPAIREAVVTARQDAGADTYLVGYYTTSSASAIDAMELRAHLKASLPDYMVPQHFVPVASFPLTPNGKIDRKALPAPTAATAARAPSTALRPPATPAERELEAIWKELLKCDQVGTDQNFFEIGGHSLLGISMGVEITKRFGVKLPLSQLMRTPTIEGLAQVLDARSGTKSVSTTADSHLVEIRAGWPKKIFFVYDGFGEIMPYLNLAQAMPAEYGVYGILPRTQEHIPLAHLSVSQMAKHCMDVVRRQQPEGPYLVGGLCAGGVIAFATAEWLEDQGDEVQAVLLLDAVVPTVAVKWWRDSMYRWRRFAQAIQAGTKPACSPSTADGGSSAEATTRKDAARRALGKIQGFLAYEAQKTAQTISTAIRYRIFRHVLENRRSWPAWVPPLTVPDIYAATKTDYHPGVIRAPMLLVRAGVGVVDDVDTPVIDLVLDPKLGWEGHSQAGLRVLDAEGGHSSMLQKPHVVGLAKQVVDELSRCSGGAMPPTE